MSRISTNCRRVCQVAVGVLVLLQVAGGLAAPAEFASGATGEMSLSRLRSCCESLLQDECGDETMFDARQFLQMTGQRVWTYDAQGEWRQYVGTYWKEVVRNNKLCVIFTSKYFVPWELLSAADQRVVARIKDLGPKIRDDYFRREREKAEQLARAEREAEEARERAARYRRPRRVNIGVSAMFGTSTGWGSLYPQWPPPNPVWISPGPTHPPVGWNGLYPAPTPFGLLQRPIYYP